MIWIAVPVLAIVGLFLSAFFSGSEIAFYRATRLRLVLDALAGDRISRGLVWLTNHPSIFVATTLVGQAQGAGDSKEAERRGWMTGLIGAVAMSAVGVVLFAFAPQIIALFNEAADPLVAEAGIAYLRINAIVEPFLALSLVIRGALDGAGDTKPPLYYTIIAQWLVRLPLSYVLVMVQGVGVIGAWYALAISTVIQGVLTAYRFRSNKWKVIRV